MKSGGGKQKGSAFERKVCQQLSAWVTGGKRLDCFWRSAMSGGRSTVGRKRGVDLSRQAGDICSVSPEGHVLTDAFYIETKFYKDLNVPGFLLGYGTLWRFWKETCKQARINHRHPMLIARQNQYSTLLLARPDTVSFVVGVTANIDTPRTVVSRGALVCMISEFDEVLKHPWILKP